MVKKVKKEKVPLVWLWQHNDKRHNKYLDVLINEKMIRYKMKRIQSKQHKIGTNDVCKISVSCFDDKRYILDYGINSLAYFPKDSRSQ